MKMIKKVYNISKYYGKCRQLASCTTMRNSNHKQTPKLYLHAQRNSHGLAKTKVPHLFIK